MQEDMPMRPRSIVLFERLYLVAIAIDAARAAADWPALLQSTALDVGVRLAPVLVSLLLVLLTSRRRQLWAGLLLGALFVIGLPMIATVMQPGLPFESSAVIFVQVILQALALVSLVAPASRAWLSRPTPTT